MPRKKKSSEPAIVPPAPEPVFVASVPQAPKRGPITDGNAILAKRLLNELAGRQIEALRLYTPLPAAAPFHADKIRTKLALGSNQAGKTLVAAIEFARAVTGQDPDKKYPEKDGIAFIFGLTNLHLGATIYRKVFRAGAFDIIRDLETKLWRTFDPIKDADRKKESKPAPPLIPPRFIESIAWESKKEQIPKLIRLVNGWELYFFSAHGEKPQGQQIDLWWIDEEIGNEEIFDELVARSMKREGHGLWSATPQNASLQLFNLHEMADQQAAMPTPDVREYKFRIIDNPFISQAEKDRIYRTWEGDQRDIRFHGEFALKSWTVYPEFDLGVHGYDDKFVPPPDWSCYFSTDPGYDICATLFLAVPPPKLGKFVVIYDELYLRQCSAAIYGKGMATKSNRVCYESGFIDSRMGRQHDMGTGITYEEQYRRALVNNSVEMRNGTYFTWASDDPKAGIEAVRDWLRISASTGKPYLFVVGQKCPNFLYEVKRYRYKRIKKADGFIITDEPDKSTRKDHLMDDLRYLAVGAPVYRKPKLRKGAVNPVVTAMEKKRAKAKGDVAGGISLG